MEPRPCDRLTGPPQLLTRPMLPRSWTPLLSRRAGDARWEERGLAAALVDGELPGQKPSSPAPPSNPIRTVRRTAMTELSNWPEATARVQPARWLDALDQLSMLAASTADHPPIRMVCELARLAVPGTTDVS